MRRRLCLIVLLFALVAAAKPAHAQQVPARDTTAAAADTTPRIISPGKAFLRSVLVPGWGQFSVHANTRGVVFVALQSTSWYMLVKTLNRLSDAQNRAADSLKFARAWVSDTLHAHVAASTDTAFVRRMSNPDTFKIEVNAAADTVAAVKATRALVNSREQQRQDWITYTLFLTLASGVDAFVAAHLADFPATITTRRELNGAYQVKLTVPFPRRRP